MRILWLALENTILKSEIPQTRRTGAVPDPADQGPYPWFMPLSYVRIERDAVVVRRWPRRERRVGRSDIDRFVVLKTRGEDGVSPPRLGIREPYDYVALLMKDGRSVRVPSKDAEPAAAALRLNNELLAGQGQ